MHVVLLKVVMFTSNIEKTRNKLLGVPTLALRASRTLRCFLVFFFYFFAFFTIFLLQCNQGQAGFLLLHPAE